jgi:hypothetical protein
MTTMISKGDRDVSLYYDHCPTWCHAHSYGGGERTEDDEIGLPHGTSSYSATGSRVFAQLEQEDRHRRPRSEGMAEPFIAISQGDVDLVRLSRPEARSLARILTHLADLEEL